MPTINEEFLTSSGMNEAHAALTAKYPWFLHVKPTRKFELIKKSGLKPRSQGCPTNPTVAAAIGKLVSNVNEMIFLRPIKTADSTPRRGEKMFMMAIPNDVIPKILTIDWTSDGTWNLAAIIKKDSPTASSATIFCEIIRRRGSVAIYETIGVNRLRVWKKGQQEDDPSTWPLLIDTEFTDILAFD